MKTRPKKSNGLPVINHAVSVLPEVVAALEGLLKNFVTVGAFPEFVTGGKNDEYIDKATAETVARAALAKANQVNCAMSATVNKNGELAVAICPDCETHSVLDPTWLSTDSLNIECDNCWGENKPHKIVKFVRAEPEAQS
jgi:Zn ribbon nucleic-acid-binding protein